VINSLVALLKQQLITITMTKNIAPKPTQNQIDSIMVLYSKGQIEEALELLGNFIKDYPNESLLYNICGICYFGRGQFTKAVENFELALLIDPDYAEAHSNLGAAFQELVQFEAALRCYKRALMIKPDYVEAHSNLGNVLKNLGQLNAAVKSYEQALAIQPDHANVHSNLGDTLKELGQLDEASKSYERSLKINPSNPLFNYKFAVDLLAIKKFKQAINYFQISQHEDWEENILLCLYKLREFEEFKNQLIKIVTKNKTSPLLGALSMHYSQNFEVKNFCNFCPSPLDYVFHASVPELLVDNCNFVDKLLHDINHAEIIEREQGRLTLGVQSSGNLLTRSEESFKNLSDILRKLIKNYYESLKNIENDFIKYFPKNIEFYSSWYIKMQNGGHLTSHIHEKGWLSGAIYLSIPKHTKNNNEGAIELSIDGDNYPRLHNRFSKKIIPLMVGDILLFPSSVFHRTIPFNSDEERICIAFDIKPDYKQV
jgi:tetratricopeptide (TPR) repeat protein